MVKSLPYHHNYFDFIKFLEQIAWFTTILVSVGHILCCDDEQLGRHSYVGVEAHGRCWKIPPLSPLATKRNQITNSVGYKYIKR